VPCGALGILTVPLIKVGFLVTIFAQVVGL